MSRDAQVTHDLVSGESELLISEEDGRVRQDRSGIEYEESASERYTLSPQDPLSAKVECLRTVKLLLPFPTPQSTAGFGRGEDEEGDSVEAVEVQVRSCLSTSTPEAWDMSHWIKVTRSVGQAQEVMLERQWEHREERVEAKVAARR